MFRTSSANLQEDTVVHVQHISKTPYQQPPPLLLASMVSAFEDLYSTDIRWFSLVRMLNRAFDLEVSHMELFMEMRGTPFPGLLNHDWMRE